MLPRYAIRTYRLFALSEFVIATWDFAARQWASGAALVMMGLVLGTWGHLYRGAYRHGWMEGRLELLRAVDEAHDRGIPHGQMMAAELERNLVAYQLKMTMGGGK